MLGWHCPQFLPNHTHTICWLQRTVSGSMFWAWRFVHYDRVVMTLICGLMGKFSCPICLVPHEKLSKILNVHQLHTSVDAKVLCVQAQESITLEVREQILSSKSLCDVNISLLPQIFFYFIHHCCQNSFNTMKHTNVFCALSFDKIHSNDKGNFNHLWMELHNRSLVLVNKLLCRLTVCKFFIL
jgi:hypothetical protein